MSLPRKRSWWTKIEDRTRENGCCDQRTTLFKYRFSYDMRSHHHHPSERKCVCARVCAPYMLRIQRNKNTPVRERLLGVRLYRPLYGDCQRSSYSTELRMMLVNVVPKAALAACWCCRRGGVGSGGGGGGGGDARRWVAQPVRTGSAITPCYSRTATTSTATHRTATHRRLLSSPPLIARIKQTPLPPPHPRIPASPRLSPPIRATRTTLPRARHVWAAPWPPWPSPWPP